MNSIIKRIICIIVVFELATSGLAVFGHSHINMPILMNSGVIDHHTSDDAHENESDCDANHASHGSQCHCQSNLIGIFDPPDFNILLTYQHFMISEEKINVSQWSSLLYRPPRF